MGGTDAGVPAFGQRQHVELPLVTAPQRAYRRSFPSLVAAALLFSAAACRTGEESSPPRQTSATPPSVGAEAETPEKLLVCAVNYPLQYFADRIGAELTDVALPAPPDTDPSVWRPNRAEAKILRDQCELILTNGPGYAVWTDRASLPEDRVVDTTARVRERLLAAHVGEQQPGAVERRFAPATWLDPEMAIEQARTVAAALAERRPAHSAAIASRLERLEADLRDIDERLAAATAELKPLRVVVSSPVYGYFTRRYGLTASAFRDGAGPAFMPEDWRFLDTLRKDGNAVALLFDVRPANDTRNGLAERAIPWALVATAANRPDTGDFVIVMRENARRLQDLWRKLGASVK